MYDATSREAIIENLKDAGCPPEKIEEFLACMESHKSKEELELLAEHRECLLAEVHKCQKKIDCLDYLAYQIGKNEQPKK